MNASVLSDAGIRPRDTAHMLATLLQLSHRPATLLLRDLAGVDLRPDVIRTGKRGLTAGEAHLLGAAEGTPCRWRTGRLVTEDGTLAAGAFLLWLPGRLPAGTCRDLDAGAEPAGTILGRLPGGMRREQRRAAAVSVIDEITGEDAALMSRAVLVAGGAAAGITEENWAASFAESLAA